MNSRYSLWLYPIQFLLFESGIYYKATKRQDEDKWFYAAEEDEKVWIL